MIPAAVLDRKPILSTTDALSVLPGGGSGILRLFRAAHWLKPCVDGKRPFYRSSDVRACLERLGKGELPQAVYMWRSALGQDSAHLVDASGRPVCACREREWLHSAASSRLCTRCQGAAKTLNVANAA